MKKARAIDTLVFKSNLNYKRIQDEFNVFESWYETPLSPRKKQKKPKTHSFNLVLIYAFHLCPTCSGYSGACPQCVYHGTRV